MSPEELEREIGGNRFRPVYFFLGEEEYLRRHALALLKKECLTEDAFAFNYSEFSGRSDAVGQVLHVARTFPMMSPRRVVVLSELDALAKTDQETLREADQKALSDYVGDPQTRTILVLVGENVDRRTRFFKLMKERACVVEFTKLKGPALERWAEGTLRKHEYKMSAASLKRLVDQGGADLQTLNNELEKLFLYCGNEKTISDLAVEELVGRSRNSKVFELIDALAIRDRKAALRVLGNLLDSGERPEGIVAMMARHFRQVLIVKELQQLGRDGREIGTTAQIPGFLVPNFLRQARDLKWTTAETMYRRLAEADLRFKSTAVDKRIFLEKLICAFP